MDLELRVAYVWYKKTWVKNFSSAKTKFHPQLVRFFLFNTSIFQFFSSKPSDPKADDFMDAFHQCRCRGAEGVNAISSATMRNILHLDVEVSWYWKYELGFFNKTPLYVGLCLRKLNFRCWNVDALGQDLWKYIRSIKPKGNDHNDQHAVWSWSNISNNCDPQKDALMFYFTLPFRNTVCEDVSYWLNNGNYQLDGDKRYGDDPSWQGDSLEADLPKIKNPTCEMHFTIVPHPHGIGYLPGSPLAVEYDAHGCCVGESPNHWFRQLYIVDIATCWCCRNFVYILHDITWLLQLWRGYQA